MFVSSLMKCYVRAANLLCVIVVVLDVLIIEISADEKIDINQSLVQSAIGFSFVFEKKRSNCNVVCILESIW